AVECVHHADDDQQERGDLGDRLEFLPPRIAEVGGVRTEAALPQDEDRPQDEQPGQQYAGQYAGEEQSADRGFGGDAVKDQRDRWRDQDAERTAGADRAGGDVVGVAAAAHLRDAHLADGGAAGRRGTGQRREDRAGADV